MLPVERRLSKIRFRKSSTSQSFVGFCAHVTVVGKGIAAIDGPCAGYPAPRDGQHDLLRGLCGRARENPRWALPLAPGPGSVGLRFGF